MDMPCGYVGQLIVTAEITGNALALGFEGGKRIYIFDAGQLCCESRYITTDDDVRALIGHRLTRVSSEVCNTESGEACFVTVGTDAGFITLENHNEHNGYYSGFALKVMDESDFKRWAS